jgi:beta-galactosidase
VHEYRADLGRFEPLEFEGEGLGDVTALTVGMPRPGEQPPAGFGERAGRASAPARAQIALHGTAWTLQLPTERRGRRFLEIDGAGDVAQLEADGEVVADRFWDGTTWTIGLDALGIAEDARLFACSLPRS